MSLTQRPFDANVQQHGGLEAISSELLDYFAAESVGAAEDWYAIEQSLADGTYGVDYGGITPVNAISDLAQSVDIASPLAQGVEVAVDAFADTALNPFADTVLADPVVDATIGGGVLGIVLNSAGYLTVAGEAVLGVLGSPAVMLGSFAAFDAIIWEEVINQGVALYNETHTPVVVSPNLNGSYTFAGPTDPNSIYGPGGYGPEGFVAGDVPLPYFITFDNKATADAPAQVVTVTEQLDANLDWSTFQLADFDFGGAIYPIPAGLTSYSTVIDDTASEGVYVDVDASFNALTGLLTWTFTSIDPTTFDVPVGNPEEGFLPPDVNPPEGDGFVSYSVDPAASDTTGTDINAQGTVIFQAGLPDQSSLNTQKISNTIDDGPPTSSVKPLPAYSPASFTVGWAGEDDPGGSGIRSYDIYVSDNGGPFTLWQADTAQTSGIYTGQNGQTYSFYSVATDNVGNQQPTPSAAQATTQIDAVPPPSSVGPLPPESPPSFRVSWSGSDDAGGSGIASFSIFVSINGGPFNPWITDTTQTSGTYTGQVGDTYGFYSVATDNVGNVQPTPAAAQATTRVISSLSVSSFAVISPNPRNSAVSSIDVTFSEPVNLTTFTGSALTLTDDGGPNLITGAVTVSLVSGSTYQINGLAGLTTANGNYTLTVNSAGIQNAYGKAGTNSLSTSWLMDTTPPTSTISALPPRETSMVFPVSATGSDGGSPPSGISSYNIYASTNGGPWTFWTNVPAS